MLIGLGTKFSLLSIKMFDQDIKVENHYCTVAYIKQLLRTAFFHIGIWYYK